MDKVDAEVERGSGEEEEVEEINAVTLVFN
jgi:hypothetical protein